MSNFCLLRDPDNYVADQIDLVADEKGRKYWLDHFEQHFVETLDHALARYGRTARKEIEAARAEFAGSLARLREDPESLGDGKLDVISLCKLRDGTLRKHGLNDPFMHIKQRENTAAVEIYKDVIARLGELDGRDKWLTLIKGVFAGNVFDLGSPATMHLADQPTDFVATLAEIKPRPWFIDDFDRLAEDLPDSPPTNWGKAVVFVDNAGSDFVLGILPLVRELALYGTKIVLAANELPCLNDITADETVEVVETIAAQDEDLAALIRADMFEVVSSGSEGCLIDLLDVTDELNEAAADADLLILEGMGRSVETNFDTAFTVDTLKLAILKDEQVASRIGGKVFDCICRYQPAGS